MHPRVRAVVRPVVMAVNTPLARSRLGRELAAAPRPFRLEIGGLVRRPGWVITNVNAVTRNYLDATGTWPIDDDAISHIYSDNVIEHIPLEAARAMLREAYRCLQPGGVIRIVTPDIRAHVELYLAGRTSLQDQAVRSYRSIGLTVEHPVDIVRIPIGSFGHHTGYVYDFDALDAELTAAGFHGTVRCAWGQSEHTELRGLDQRVEEGAVQIAVEATR